MAVITGADSNRPLSQGLFDLASSSAGRDPVFWGRYFKGPGNTDPVQFQTSEQAIFRQLGLKLLPFARQTNRVGGSKAGGLADGAKNAAALIAAIDIDLAVQQTNALYMFLDTEPEVTLSTAYFAGWSQGVIKGAKEASDDRLTIFPGVYLNHNDHGCCRHLAAAMEQGAECWALIVARYATDNPQDLQPPAWSDARVAPVEAIPAPVVIWQYVGDFGPNQELDGDLLNPSFPDVLEHLIVP